MRGALTARRCLGEAPFTVMLGPGVVAFMPALHQVPVNWLGTVLSLFKYRIILTPCSPEHAGHIFTKYYNRKKGRNNQSSIHATFYRLTIEKYGNQMQSTAFYACDRRNSRICLQISICIFQSFENLSPTFTLNMKFLFCLQIPTFDILPH